MSLPFFVSPPPPGSTDEQRKEYNKMLKQKFGGRSLENTAKEGDLKTEIKYAWFPKKVCGVTIWLKSYEQLFEYKIRDRITDTGRMVIKWHGGGWDLIKERI